MTPNEPDSLGFYEALAGEYDRMIDVERRLPAAAGLVERLAREAPIRRAVDLATGTGVYALALARAGIETVGMDLSPGMLEQAAAHAGRLGLPVTWIAGPMQDVASLLTEPVDLVLCLGNSLPHLLTGEELAATLGGIAARLRPGGRLVCQFINYRRVLATGERIVAVTRAGETEYVRFYDFLDGLVRFNVLTIHWSGDGKASPALRSTTLRPWLAEDVAAAARQHGFAEVTLAGDLRGGAWDPATSEAVVVTASRGL